MKFLIITYLLSSLINSLPNHNAPNHNLCNSQLGKISSKSVTFSYDLVFCHCSNSPYDTHPTKDLDYPYAIFTSDASKYLRQNNANRPSLFLSYDFDNEYKMDKYCSLFKTLKWKCDYAQISPNTQLNNNNINNNTNTNTINNNIIDNASNN